MLHELVKVKREGKKCTKLGERNEITITIEVEVIKAVIKIYVYMKLSDKTFENLGRKWMTSQQNIYCQNSPKKKGET